MSFRIMLPSASSLRKSFLSVRSGLALLALSLSCGTSRGTVVWTQHYDNARTGVNAQETILTPKTVNPFQFGKLWDYNVLRFGPNQGDYDYHFQGQPLYVPGVVVPGKGIHNVIYIASMYGAAVYALDADSKQDPLWKANLIDFSTGDTFDEGVTSTPVIDVSTNTLYADASVIHNGHGIHVLHALDIRTGAEKFGGPVQITASVPGTGTGSSNGVLPFTENERNRAALLLSGGVVYLCYAAQDEHPDNPSLDSPYHGWVIGYDAATLQRVSAWCDTPNGEGGGIWMSGGGPAVDADGYIYLVTGDGTYTANVGGSDYGDSFVKLDTHGGLVPVDFGTPSDQDILNLNDLDLGSGGPTLFDTTGPHPHQIVAQGKDQPLYFADRDNLGQFAVGSHFLAVLTTPTRNFSQFAAWNNQVYTCGISDVPRSYNVGGPLTTPQIASQATGANYGYAGSTPVITANGSTGAIAWFQDTKNGSGGGATYIHAYDANDLSKEFWNSTMNATQDTILGAQRFGMIVVANGKVYVPTLYGVSVLGLRPTLYGDVDANGVVNMADAVQLVQQAAGLSVTTNRPIGDVSPDPTDTAPAGDGIIDLGDAVRVLRYVTGVDSSPLGGAGS